MARRLVRNSGSSMALVLLLAAAAVLSNNAPSSTVSSSSLPLPVPASSETTTSAGGGEHPPRQASGSSAHPPPQASGSAHDPEQDHEPGGDDEYGDDEEDEQEQAEQETDPEKRKQRQKEQQAAREQAVREEKEAQKKMLKFAKEKHVVSFTNGAGSYKGIAREFVTAHNNFRRKYRVAPLTWDKKLARLARRWSNAMRKDCQLMHTGGQHDYGQSVYLSHDNWNATAKDAVDFWGTEENLYDQNTEKCRPGKNFTQCGHFALMVKKSFTKVGCARAECFKGGVFVTCNYRAGGDKKDKKQQQQQQKITTSH